MKKSIITLICIIILITFLLIFVMIYNLKFESEIMYNFSDFNCMGKIHGEEYICINKRINGNRMKYSIIDLNDLMK